MQIECDDKIFYDFFHPEHRFGDKADFYISIGKTERRKGSSVPYKCRKFNAFFPSSYGGLLNAFQYGSLRLW